MTRRILYLIAALAVLGGEAMAEEFSSRAQAMDFLAAALPAATAANPKYRTVGDGTVSRWLTQEIRFSGTGAVTVEMRESYTQEKDGKTTSGTHAATFSLADVELTEFAEPGDVTPEGAPSRGVLFSCKAPGCVAAVWGGQGSKADKTDISLQDDGARAKILAAFRYLKTNKGS
jgi:hypothetical protein